MFKIDHIERAHSRLAIQFSESENLKNYIAALLSEANASEQLLCDILEKRSIDTAEGVQLDIIGALVGQSRIIQEIIPIIYFGFDDDTISGGFDTSPFREENDPGNSNKVLTDEEYRVFIRARIFKNSSRPTINNLARAISNLLGGVQVIITEGVASLTISIGSVTLTAQQKIFIEQTDLIPKPAGVGIEGFTYFDPDDIFTFDFGGAGYDQGSFNDS